MVKEDFSKMTKNQLQSGPNTKINDSRQPFNEPKPNPICQQRNAFWIGKAGNLKAESQQIEIYCLFRGAPAQAETIRTGG